VVHTVRSQLRSYDSVVRLGGDEFLCVMSGATVSDARERFAAVDTSLAAPPDPCHIRVGFTELASEDLAADLIERADADMPTNHAR
jgi:GGDEF domain-containing protein